MSNKTKLETSKQVTRSIRLMVSALQELEEVALEEIDLMKECSDLYNVKEAIKTKLSKYYDSYATK